jgi:hypothetical protein
MRSAMKAASSAENATVMARRSQTSVSEVGPAW